MALKKETALGLVHRERSGERKSLMTIPVSIISCLTCGSKSQTECRIKLRADRIALQEV